MITIQIIAILVTLGAGLSQFALEYWWHDKRTKKHRWIRLLLICFMVLGALVATRFVILDGYQSKERERRAINDREKIKADLSALQAKYDQQGLEARSLEETATQQRKRLEDQLKGLQSSLDESQALLRPFGDYAKAKYPEDDVRAALEKLRNDLDSHERKIKIYDYKLRQRQIKPEDEEKFVEILKKAENGAISISYAIGDNDESYNFAIQIGELLKRAGWHINQMGTVSTSGIQGIRVEFKDLFDAPPESEFLFEALEAAGFNIEIGLVPWNNVPSNYMNLFIAPKEQ